MAPQHPTSPSPVPPAPHLSEPRLADVTEESFERWIQAAADGFHEQARPELMDFERAFLEVDRGFGFEVAGRWVSTFGALTRRLQVPGGADVPVAAITNVTVRPSHRRRGLLSAMMRRQLADCVERGEPLAVLWASEAAIYGRFGFGQATEGLRARGTSRELTLRPGVPTQGSVQEVTREEYAALAPRLHQLLRQDRPGTMSREGEAGWLMPLFDAEHARGGAGPLRYGVHHADDGEPDGLVLFRVKPGEGGEDPEVRVQELWGEGTAHTGLWRYLLDLDLVRRFSSRNTPLDDVLRWQVTDAEAVHAELTDGLYVRLVDLPAALRARSYAAPLDVVLEVEDPQLPANQGRWRLHVERGGSSGEATVEPTEDPADLSLGVLELGAAYLGGVRLHDLRRAGRVTEHTCGSVAAASTAFGWHRAPWCPDFF